MRGRALQALLFVAALTLTTAAVTPNLEGGPGVYADEVKFSSVVPVPAWSVPAPGVTYRITDATTIFAAPGAGGTADYLAQKLRGSTGFPLPVQATPGTRGIQLMLTGAPELVGEQGYQLEVTPMAIVIRAHQPAGLFHGVQTLRQLLPVAAESSTVQPGPWPVPGGTIVDFPRFGHRGAMLDVARHFFNVAQVKRYIDQLVLYKVNFLHLHLSDDQGWRIAIDSWPRLTTVGGRTAVGGNPGGFYTKSDYTEIVTYAAARHVTIVPEIDMPGHTNAALASYPELNCNGLAPRPYTGMKVGFSTLCVSQPRTYKFVDDVVREIASLTPGPYFHIGGDEAKSTTEADYTTFVNRAQAIVAAHGKTVVGWHDVVYSDELPSTVMQYWVTARTHPALAGAASRGTKVIMSPANRAYLDMKYHSSTRLGLKWAGSIEVQAAYDWDPATQVEGIGETSILGIEAPLWSETTRTSADIEYLAFPRLPALMELAWSPQATHSWTSFRQRLGAQGPRWRVMGLNFYRSGQVPWPQGS
jgi:hexosaminidase